MDDRNEVIRLQHRNAGLMQDIRMLLRQQRIHEQDRAWFEANIDELQRFGDGHPRTNPSA